MPHAQHTKSLILQGLHVNLASDTHTATGIKSYLTDTDPTKCKAPHTACGFICQKAAEILTTNTKQKQDGGDSHLQLHLSDEGTVFAAPPSPPPPRLLPSATSLYDPSKWGRLAIISALTFLPFFNRVISSLIKICSVQQ